MDIAVLVLSIVGILLSLAAVLLPVLPGLVFIWLIILSYGLYDHWQHYGFTFVVVAACITALGMLLDQVAGILGARKFGAGLPGMIGAFVGALSGLILLNIPGLVLGTFVGAFFGELLFGKGLKASSYAGLGALLGFITGTLGKFILGLIMLGSFVYLTIFQ